MLLLDGALGLFLLALWIFCLIDVITTDESQCRNLPKFGWVMIVLFLSAVGGVVWIIAGRPLRAASLPYRGNRGNEFPEYERPGRFEATNPDDDEEFLRKCRERAEEQRRTYREQKDSGLDSKDPPSVEDEPESDPV